tara:strand:- start:10740 stop:11471 length:732 start_codon:yes stop_codon:yes gene_type:complete
MAISVDTVYQRVLALANKEQRGYVTPQEFNLLANQAQMSIFESYFYAKNQRERAESARTNEVDETDIGELLGAKLSPFRKVQAVTSGHTFLGVGTIGSVERDVFQTGRVFLGNDVCHKLSLNEASRILRSKRHIATTASQFPIYTDNPADARDILVYAGSTSAEATITAEYFLVPKVVNWAYVVVNSKALYNATLGVDFELHRSEEDTLVYDILALAGIVINKTQLAQTASQIGIGEQQLQNV